MFAQVLDLSHFADLKYIDWGPQEEGPCKIIKVGKSVEKWSPQSFLKEIYSRLLK